MKISLILFLLFPGLSRACPESCECKWTSGYLEADCSNAGLTSVPSAGNRDIIGLILNGNPLGSLPKDVFKEARLQDLKVISLNNCSLHTIHEDAFRGLKNLNQLDISFNNITKLGPKLLEGSTLLDSLKIVRNPITSLSPYQFPQLQSLRNLDLSQCRLAEIHKNAFKNLEGLNLKTISLHDNVLRSLHPETFSRLPKLSVLKLYGNPWSCDCNLKTFRDFVMRKRLYQRPTKCVEPDRLSSKMWDEIDDADFACKPVIYIPSPVVFSISGHNATLPCLISGSPTPKTRWVLDGKVLNNETQVASERAYIVSSSSDGAHARWYNLTVLKVGSEDIGDYTCVAENNGGVMERVSKISFEQPNAFASFSQEELTVIIGVTAASVAFLVLLLLLLCCCFCSRRRRQKKLAAKEAVKNSESRQALLPRSSSNNSTLPKPPYIQHEVEMSDIRLIQDPDHYPDLLDIPNRYRGVSPTGSSSTAPDHSRLHHYHFGNVVLNPAHLNTSGSFVRSGTLPHRHRPAPSCDCHHSGIPVQILPVVPTSSRPGYVTLPRRPRSASASPSYPVPLNTMTVDRRSIRQFQGPIYDGVGPRRSADGSSRSSLTTRPTPSPRYPPLYTPIEEEVTLKSAPSETTLLEESISSYCEPFGKAVVPNNKDYIQHQKKHSTSGSKSTILPKPVIFQDEGVDGSEV